MSLQDLEEKIYSRKNESGDAPGAAFQNGSAEEEGSSPFEPAFFKTKQEDKAAIWIKEDAQKQEKMKKIKKVALIVVASLLVAAGLVWAVIYARQSAFSEDKVTLAISGPDKVKSGDLVTIAIHYDNANRVDLKNAVLHMSYTENFKPVGNLNTEPEGPNAASFSIGTLKKKSSDTFELQGRFFGTKDMLVYINVKMEYSSANFSSIFATENKYGAVISSSPLAVEAALPQNVSSGGAVSLTVRYRNDGQQVFRNLKLKADFPRDFTFSNSEPLPEKSGNIWYIGDLEGGQTGEIKITGTLAGQAAEVKQFKFSLGDMGGDEAFVSYSEISGGVKITGAPIAIAQTVNDQKDSFVANAGGNLHFKIKFKNTSDIPLKDLIITEELVNPVLDYATFQNGMGTEGSLDSSKGIITWKAPGMDKLKTLAPGEEGVVDFSIKVKDKLPVSGPKDKNFSFVAIPRIDSPDIPTPEGQNKTIQGNAVAVKVNSKLIVKEQGFYNDQEITNSGPIPPKVGQETTFAIRVNVQNIANDVTNAKVVIILAPGVEWKNNFLPKDASIEHNGRTNEVVWNIGTLPAGIGVITDPKEIAFQISVKPSVDAVGKSIVLTQSVDFTADDVFTGQKLEAKLGPKDSSLPEDISVSGAGRVEN